MSVPEKQYDIIFFRNALIYFSSVSRQIVINNLCEALLPDGLFFLSASETSAIKHPLLSSRFTSDVFYFQKIKDTEAIKQINLKQNNLNQEKTIDFQKKKIKHKLIDHPQPVSHKELSINYREITDILKIEEGKENAEYILDMVSNGNTASLSGSCLAAAVIFYLNYQDFNFTEKILSFLEKHNKDACTKFLRGELFFLLGNVEEAEQYYQEASFKDKHFWPAFYRISVLSSEGNKTRYEYKKKKAIESIELSKKNEHSKEPNYEFFLGGFSPDYFLRILEKKLA
jgi:chemotaxis protein methyltransferase CheR